MIVVIASIDWSEAVGARQLAVRRPGSAAPRTPPAGRSRWRSPATPARTMINLGLLRERQCQEDPAAHEIRRDHQAAAREAIDERTGENADEDHRQEVRDQEGGHPLAGLGAIPDVDGKRDEREPGADTRAEVGQREVTEARHARQERDLPSNQSMGDSRDHSEHWRRRLIHVESEGDFGRKLTSPEYTRQDMSVPARPAAAGSRFRALLVHANPFQRVTPVPAYGLERLRTAAESTGAEVEILDPYLFAEDAIEAARAAAERLQPDVSASASASSTTASSSTTRPRTGTARSTSASCCPRSASSGALWARSFRRRPSSQEVPGSRRVPQECLEYPRRRVGCGRRRRGCVCGDLRRPAAAADSWARAAR